MTDFKGDFHIAIVGAGLAGLATAILLRRAGYKVTVLEQDAELREVRDLRSHQRLLLIKSIQIGAGIQLPANANKVLAEMGILDKILEQAVRPQAIKLYSYQSAAVLSTLNLDTYVQNTYGIPHLVMHRADLRRLLFDEAEAQDVCVRLGTKIIPEHTEIFNGVIRLASDEQITADLIIGADGASSMCRRVLVEEPRLSKATGRIGNRIVIDSDVMLQDERLKDFVLTPNIHVWLGPESLAVCYLLKGLSMSY